jgi:RNA polymerase sigma-70 factor (ECF subfamily)
MARPSVALQEQTDEDLIARFQEGERGGFEELVERHKDRVVNFAYRITGNIADAEDVAQDTFLRIFRKKDSYAPVAKFNTWMYTIASNLAKTRLRQRRRHDIFSIHGRASGDDEREFELPDASRLPDAEADRAMMMERLERAMLELPAKFKEVLVLCDVEDLPYEEICRITGLNAGTLKSRLNRARARLRESFFDG